MHGGREGRSALQPGVGVCWWGEGRAKLAKEGTAKQHSCACCIRWTVYVVVMYIEHEWCNGLYSYITHDWCNGQARSEQRILNKSILYIYTPHAWSKYILQSIIYTFYVCACRTFLNHNAINVQMLAELSSTHNIFNFFTRTAFQKFYIW